MSTDFKIIPEIIELNLFYDFEEPVLRDDLINALKVRGFDEEGSKGSEFIEVPGIGLLEKVTIAKKRGCSVNYDTKRGVLGTAGVSLENVPVVFKELKDVIDELGLLEDVKRCEFHTRCKIQVGKKPISTLKLISQAFPENYLLGDKLSKIEEIFEAKLQPFCIRLCSKSPREFVGDLRKKEEWIDIYIFPYISNT